MIDQSACAAAQITEEWLELKICSFKVKKPILKLQAPEEAGPDTGADDEDIKGLESKKDRKEGAEMFSVDVIYVSPEG